MMRRGGISIFFIRRQGMENCWCWIETRSHL